MKEELQNLVKEFKIDSKAVDIKAFGSGHINDTFLVRTENDESFVLQRINHKVFPNVEELMQNYRKVTDHIKTKLENQDVQDIDRKVLQLIQTHSGKDYVKQGENYWRMLRFIPEAKSYDLIENKEQAYQGGKAFGLFQKQLADFPANELYEVIPDFHDIDFRISNFEKALEKNFANRKTEVAEEIQFVQERFSEMKKLKQAGEIGEIPERITHNDTKFNNVLLDENDRALCVIDLDTVMNGFMHFDYGDAIRTGASTAAEDEPDLNKINFNWNHFKAFTEGFLENTSNIFQETEIKWMGLSIRFMIFIMGLRFLTDYLDGDNYYKIAYAEHNLVRARNQFQLLKVVESQKEEIETEIHRIYKGKSEK